MMKRGSFYLFLGMTAALTSAYSSDQPKKKRSVAAQASPAARWFIQGPSVVVGEGGDLDQYRTMFRLFGVCYDNDSSHANQSINCTLTASSVDEMVIRQSLEKLTTQFANYLIDSMQELGLRRANVTESEQRVADCLQEIHKLTESLHAKKAEHAAEEDIKRLEEQIAAQTLSLEEMKDSMAAAMLYELREFVEQELPTSLVGQKVFDIINDSLELSVSNTVQNFVDNYVVIEEKVENNGLSEPGDIIIEEEEEVSD